FGIDGWRLDVPTEIDDDEFWREFRRRVKAANPEAYIVGEIWHEAKRWLGGDQSDAVMNYPFARASIGFFGRETFAREYRPGGFRLRPLRGRAFGNEIERMLALYAWPITLVQMNLLDSHDTASFLHQAGGDKSALRLAMLFQMTMPGAPNIYYGTEIGLSGGHDPDCRRTFPWDQRQWDRDLYQFSKRAIALRHAHPALRRGQFETLYSNDDIYAFARRLDDDRLAVIFNAGAEATEVTLDVHNLLPDGILTDVCGGLPGRVSKEKLRGFVVPPRSAAVFSAR
ncbi:MAG: alpha-amylase family glycosyl hydrolase, partial [Thermoguttaceae bacterium]